MNEPAIPNRSPGSFINPSNQLFARLPSLLTLRINSSPILYNMGPAFINQPTARIPTAFINLPKNPPPPAAIPEVTAELGVMLFICAAST